MHVQYVRMNVCTDLPKRKHNVMQQSFNYASFLSGNFAHFIDVKNQHAIVDCGFDGTPFSVLWIKSRIVKLL